MNKVDFIIVGQGIAGTLLAHELIEQNNKVLIINKPHPAMASTVAAGLFNPVGVKRCIPSWGAERFLAESIQRYKALEEKMKASFLRVNPIYRLLANEDNRKQWQVKYSNEGMDAYITSFEEAHQYPHLKDDFGGALIHPAGNLQMEAFLSESKKYFKETATYLEEVFDLEGLRPDEGQYKDYTFDQVVFCEGFQVINNPYFNWLPFSPTKGEVLTIRIPSVESMDRIVSKGVFVMPLGNHLYRVGATFNHQEWDDVVTEQGIAYLKERIEDILTVDYEVVEARAGVRPTVRDRRPFLGRHPKHSKLAIFNGLGSRGVIQGPSLAADFCRFLTQAEKIGKETDIQRYIRFYE